MKMDIKKGKKSMLKKNDEKAEEMAAEKKAEIAEEEKGKKDAEEENESAETKEREDNNLKALRWIIGVGIVVMALVFFGIWYSEASKKFEYIGLDFKKEMFGQIQLYTAQLSGYNANGQQINFKVAFRNDPRTLKNIPVNATIRFFNNKEAYVSLNLTEEMSQCKNASIALSNYGYFMTSIGFKVKNAGITKDIANKYNMTLANCNTHLQNTVLAITPSNETKIEQSPGNENCYILSFKDCEILQVMERFEIATLAHFKGEEI